LSLKSSFSHITRRLYSTIVESSIVAYMAYGSQICYPHIFWHFSLFGPDDMKIRFCLSIAMLNILSKISLIILPLLSILQLVSCLLTASKNTYCYHTAQLIVILILFLLFGIILFFFLFCTSISM